MFPGAVGENSAWSILFYFLRILFIYLGREGERKTEKHQRVTASHTPPTWEPDATQACAPTRNWTSDARVHSLAFNPLSNTSQGPEAILKGSLAKKVAGHPRDQAEKWTLRAQELRAKATGGLPGTAFTHVLRLRHLKSSTALPTKPDL